MLVKALDNCSSIYIPRPAENNFLKSHCRPSNIFWEINGIILNTVRTQYGRFISPAYYAAYNEQSIGNACRFLLPGTYTSRRPSAYHIDNYNTCQNTGKVLGLNACHLMAIYVPLLPASERWQHSTQRQWGISNKKGRARTWAHHGTRWSCPPHLCISHPACAGHLSTSWRHVHWSFIPYTLALTPVTHPTTCQMQDIWENGEALKLSQLVT